jgi:hypothetical protein
MKTARPSAAVIEDSAALIWVRHTVEPMAADWDAAAPADKADHLATAAAWLAGAEPLLARFGGDLLDRMGFAVPSISMALLPSAARAINPARHARAARCAWLRTAPRSARPRV